MSSDDLGSPWFISADSPQDRRLKGAWRFLEFPEFSLLGFLERRNPIPRRTNGHVLYGRVVADCVWLDPPTSGPSSHRCLLSRWKVSRSEQCAAADSSDVKNEIRYQLVGLYLARNYPSLRSLIIFEPERNFVPLKFVLNMPETQDRAAYVSAQMIKLFHLFFFQLFFSGMFKMRKSSWIRHTHTHTCRGLTAPLHLLSSPALLPWLD